jgi:hypothetical protein
MCDPYLKAEDTQEALQIIDLALHRLHQGNERYTCLTLLNAGRDLGHRRDIWIKIDDALEAFAKLGGEKYIPRWWSTGWIAYTEERITLLTMLRQTIERERDYVNVLQRN